MGSRSETRDEALESLRRRNADLEVLYETVKDLSSTLSVERVLQRLLDRTRITSYNVCYTKLLRTIRFSQRVCRRSTNTG